MYTATEVAYMHKVDGVRGLNPFKLHVVDHVAEVRWDEKRLNRGDICACDVSRGEPVGKVARKRLVTFRCV